MNSARVAQSDIRSETRQSSFLGRIFNWIPVLILAYPMLVSPFVTAFSQGSGLDNNITASQSNALNQLFWVGIFVLTVLTAGRRWLDLGRVLKNPVVWVVLAYLCVATLSVLWSPVPGIAFRRVVQQIILVLALMLSICLTDDKHLLLARSIMLMAVIVILNTIAVAVIPPTPLGYAGLYPQKNGLGAVMALAFIFFLYGISVTRGLKRFGMLLFAGLAFALLLLSQSKTSLGLSVVMPVAAFFLVSIAYLIRINAAALTLFSAFSAAVLWMFFSVLTRFDFTDLSLLLFNDETYTGRTIIWDFVIDVISREPMLGQGYASFWGVGSDSIVFREAPGFVVSLLQAHNGYLDVMVETGAVGLFLLLALILTSLFSIARIVQPDRQIAFLCFSLMFFVVCHNMLESSWYRGYAMNWVIFLVISFLPSARNGNTSQSQ